MAKSSYMNAEVLAELLQGEQGSSNSLWLVPYGSCFGISVDKGKFVEWLSLEYHKSLGFFVWKNCGDICVRQAIRGERI